MSDGRLQRARLAAKVLLSAVFLVAGVLHLIVPGPFLAVTPDWVPYPRSVVLVTGVVEIAGAAGLFIPRLRRPAGLGLALYAACVFPANISHAIVDLALVEPVLGWAYHAPRLAFQPVIVWWALWASGVIDWPVRRRVREDNIDQPQLGG
jgi:uncharacterized membrane protein